MISLQPLNGGSHSSRHGSNHGQEQSWGIILGSLSVFISILGAACTFPFLQSQRDVLKCDALCYGSMQSTRSGLSLIGSVVIGRLSDKIGRSKVLALGVIASACSYLILLTNVSSLTAMWISLFPSSLNQNYNVLKALFADYNATKPEAERTSALGRLGMAVGISFMLGPSLGASFLSSYTQANSIALTLTLLSGFILLFLPMPSSSSATVKPIPEKTESSIIAPAKTLSKDSNSSSSLASLRRSFHSLISFIFVPAAQTPGARLLFFMRLFMALAFHVFMTVWTVSLKERFNFGPKDHAYFMGWVGLWYALSQGVLAKQFARFTNDDPTPLVLICVFLLSIGRVLAMLTTSLVAVYVIMAAVIIALGVVNTTMSSACARLANQDEVL